MSARVLERAPLLLSRGIWGAVEPDAMLGAVTRSALEAARVVLRADYCAFAWQPPDGAPAVAVSQGITEAKARTHAASWLAAVGLQQRGVTPATTSPQLRVEAVADADGRVRGALVAALRGASAHSREARVLMPVFASHLGLLTERGAEQALRTESYEALVQIGMQIQAEEADVDHALQLIVERARDLMGTELAWIGLVHDETQTLDMEVAVGAHTEPFMNMRLRLGDGVGGVVVATGRPLVLPDYRNESLPTPEGVRAAVLGEGVGSMLCAPMLRGDRVIGALYVGSRQPMDFTATAIALTCALAAQAAVAIDNGRLYAQLQHKNELLEESSAVHRTLTEAALAGAGPSDICAQLARLTGLELALTQEVCDPFRVRCGPDGVRDGTDTPPTRSFPVVGDEELGRLEVFGADALTPLQERAVEHGATVIALELVKQRAAQEVAWQLQGDLLNELLDAPTPPPATLVSRARRHGVDLSCPHRLVAFTPAGSDPLTPSGDDLLALVRRVTGRSLLHRDAALVNLRGEHVVLVARDATEDAACSALVHAVTAAVQRMGGVVAVGVGENGAEFGLAYRQAVACAALARGDGSSSHVLHAERLGPLRFILDAADLTHVRAIAQAQLGRLAETKGRTELFSTLRAFVAADGIVAQTAEACFVHKNTVRYRLRRAGEALGRDPFDPEVRFELRIAVGLVDLFESLGVDLLAS
jgi:GAF domain-containing protein/sugar diacid utilization regulator